ncbi:MAG: DUF58 domain-containing protein [Chloroflexi bacterium]|nr:DUF58 domain-containing protein [Chloroflexota bacterium]
MKRLHLVLLLSGLSLFAALASGFYVFYTVFYALAGALLANLAWAYGNLLGLQVQVKRWPGRGAVGDSLYTEITVRNTGIFPKLLLEVRDLEQLPGQVTGRVVNLGPHGELRWQAAAPLRKRGVYPLGPVRVYSADLFGMFRHHRAFGAVEELVVRPATVELPAFHLSLAQWHSQGTSSRRTQDASPSVSTVREYTHGDSLKRIHWPSTVRTSKLMVKEFDSEVGNQAWIVLDLHRDVQGGGEIENTEEYAVTAAASIAHRLLSMNWPVGLIAYGDREYVVAAQRGVALQERLLDVLAVARAKGTIPLAEVLLKSKALSSPSPTFVVITPSTQLSWAQAANALVEHSSHVAAVLIDGSSFGAGPSTAPVHDALQKAGVAVYQVRQGEPLASALDHHSPLAASPRQGPYPGDGAGPPSRR